MALKYNPKFTQFADYIILQFQAVGEPITNLKLQKLLYYAQGWYLAIHDEPLFDDQIEAWVHGPVVPSIYGCFKQYKWSPITEMPNTPVLCEKIQAHLDEVIEVYGSFSAFELENLSHASTPWINARKGIPDDQASNAEISLEDMRAYFKKKLAEQDDSQ